MKLEQLRSLRNFAGLPPLTVEEEEAHKSEEFSFGDASAQDEPDGRQSWYLEMFYGEDGHYSVVLYSDGKCDIVEGSGPSISVNSSLGRKIIAAARKELGVGETFTIEAQSDTSASQAELSESHTHVTNYAGFLEDLKKKLETAGSADVSIKLLRTNVVGYTFK